MAFAAKMSKVLSLHGRFLNQFLSGSPRASSTQGNVKLFFLIKANFNAVYIRCLTVMVVGRSVDSTNNDQPPVKFPLEKAEREIVVIGAEWFLEHSSDDVERDVS